ncbi:MAG: hypothetical protein ABIK07_08515, partial [Planctomycetota bacterium]
DYLKKVDYDSSFFTLTNLPDGAFGAYFVALLLGPAEHPGYKNHAVLMRYSDVAKRAVDSGADDRKFAERVLFEYQNINGLRTQEEFNAIVNRVEIASQFSS